MTAGRGRLLTGSYGTGDGRGGGGAGVLMD